MYILLKAISLKLTPLIKGLDPRYLSIYLSVYLSIYGSTSLVVLGRFLFS
jgi:hypothetical protein